MKTFGVLIAFSSFILPPPPYHPLTIPLLWLAKAHGAYFHSVTITLLSLFYGLIFLKPFIDIHIILYKYSLQLSGGHELTVHNYD